MNDDIHDKSETLCQKTAGQSRRWWVAIGSLLAVSILPSPDCGAPLALHLWPLLSLLIVIRAVSRHPRQSHNEEEISADKPFDSNTSP